MLRLRVLAITIAALHMSYPALGGEIAITSAWTRAMLPGASVAGGFATITNSGRSDDRLVSISSPVAAKTEVHTMEMVNDVMTMRPVAGGLAISAGETLELKPGEEHLMLMGISTPFAEGDMVPVTFTFANGGKIDMKLIVMPANAKEMTHSGHGQGG